MNRPIRQHTKQNSTGKKQQQQQQQHVRRPSSQIADATPQSPSGVDRNEWLAKALASAGVASRRACIDLVKQGSVQVNGSVVTDPATKVDPTADTLVVNGRRVSGGATAATLCYFALHKPAGYICSNVSKQPGMRAVDLLQPWLDTWQQRHKGQLPPRLFTVGRLDVATSGLVFVTNDGTWANQVIHPSADITKEYWVTLPHDPTEQQLQLLRAGTVIEGVHVVPKLVRLRRSVEGAAGAGGGADADADADAADAPSGANSKEALNRIVRGKGGSSSYSGSNQAGRAASTGKGQCVLQLDVSEGKKHEVRLLVAAAGLKLLQLKRVRVGGFVLPNKLQPGQYLELSPVMRERVLKMPNTR